MSGISGSILDRPATTPVRRRTPFGTIAMSVLLHSIALGVIVGVQLAAAIDPPPVTSRLQAYLAPRPPMPQPPAPPAPPTPAAPAPAVRDVAPTTAPDRIADETPRPPGMPSTSLNVVGAGSPIGVAGAPVDLGAPPPVVTPAPPRPRTPMRVGGIIQPPARVTFVAPVYPAIAKLSRVEGDVGLEATIDETGRVTKVVVRQSVPLLDKAAIEAVSLWRYTPTILNGEPVAVILTVTVRFKIN